MMLLAQIAAWSMLAFSALLFVFQLVAHEIGFLIGRRQVERREAPGESIGALVGGLLGLLAFVLALTLSFLANVSMNAVPVRSPKPTPSVLHG
jgi:hypothetical protein